MTATPGPRARWRAPMPAARDGLVVVQLCHGSLGGSSRVACRLANALVRRGHAVHLLSHGPVPWALEPGVAAQALRAESADTVAPLYWDWTAAELDGFAALLEPLLTAQVVDILHYHYAQPFAGLIARVAARLGARMPATVGTLHGTDLTRCLGDGSLALDFAATGVLTTVSQHMRQLAAPLLGAPPPLLPNFVEDSWPGEDIAVTPRRPALLHVSNFRAVKDVGLLARLFLAVRAATDCELWLVGDGPELPALRRQLDASPAATDVRYLGARAAPQAQFRTASLLLSTSLEESFGLAVLEALASGTPVVATAVGGIPELLQNDVTGLLFAPDDWQATAAHIVALLGAPQRLAAMRHACLARALPLRESAVIGRYESLYRATLGAEAARSAT